MNIDIVRPTRRNHGLEHATVHVLSSRIKNLSIAGRSDGSGFWLMGDVSTEQVESAAAEALKRMQNGEHELAVHPNCGTGLVTTGIMASMAGFLPRLRRNRRHAPYINSLTPPA